MLVSMIGCHASAWGTLNKPLLDQEGFNNVFDGFAFFSDGSGQVIESDRSPHELVDDRKQQLAVHVVETSSINIQHIQRTVCRLAVNGAIAFHFGKIAHTA